MGVDYSSAPKESLNPLKTSVLTLNYWRGLFVSPTGIPEPLEAPSAISLTPNYGRGLFVSPKRIPKSLEARSANPKLRAWIIRQPQRDP